MRCNNLLMELAMQAEIRARNAGRETRQHDCKIVEFEAGDRHNLT